MEHTRPACKFDALSSGESIGAHLPKRGWLSVGLENLWLGRLTRETRMLRYCGTSQSAHKRRSTLIKSDFYENRLVDRTS
jgi:hypothetical protein